MSKYEYEIINNVEYEINYFYLKLNEEIFLAKHYIDTEGNGDYGFNIATTVKEYELEEIDLFDEDNMISKEEFEKLYSKHKVLFEIDTINIK